jgi:voltage-gated potassium channel Kch
MSIQNDKLARYTQSHTPVANLQQSKKKNIFANIRDSLYFQNFVLVMIIFTGILVGIETNKNTMSSYGSIIRLFDLLVVCVFAFEVIVKIFAEASKPWKYFLDPWNLFDFVITLASIIPLFFSLHYELINVIRIVRVLRVIRLAHELPRLELVVGTVLRGIPALSSVILFMILHFYVYAVLGVFFFGSSIPVNGLLNHFDTIPTAMLTLFKIVTFDDWSEILTETILLNSGTPEALINLFFLSFIVIGAMVILNLFIGVITSEMAEMKISEAKKLIEYKDHTIILGWSSQVFTIIRELAIANQSEKKSLIVILADQPHALMEQEIKVKVGKTGKTRVLCRTGNPFDLADLAIVAPQNAKSIILLRVEGDFVQPDSHIFKIILAVINHPQRSEESYSIVAPLADIDNYSIAIDIPKIVDKEDKIQYIVTDDLISRIITQTCRQPGLSDVYSELLSYADNEIYFYHNPFLIGKKFEDILHFFNEATVIGICYFDKTMEINPNPSMVYKQGDSVIVIAEDDSMIDRPRAIPYSSNVSKFAEVVLRTQKPERTLIMGWNHRVTMIINHLDKYLTAGSVIDVVADYDKGEEVIRRRCSELKNSVATFRQGLTTERLLIDQVINNNYDHIIILSNESAISAQEADSQTMFTLLHIRAITQNDHDFSLVSEMLDDRNRQIAAVTNPNDFIVSNKIDSLMMAQISENAYLMDIFNYLLDPVGSEIYLKPFDRYIKEDEEVDFHSVIESAKRYNEIAIGYKLYWKNTPSKETAAKSVFLNPTKSQKIKFKKGDRIIVISEFEYDLNVSKL